MDEIRKGQIALKMVRYMLCKRGIVLTKEYFRELGDASKEIGVPIEEIKQLIQPIIQEYFDELFAPKQKPENQGGAK